VDILGRWMVLERGLAQGRDWKYIHAVIND